MLEHEEKVAATAALALMDKGAQNELDEKYHGGEKPDDGPSYLKLVRAGRVWSGTTSRPSLAAFLLRISAAPHLFFYTSPSLSPSSRA